MKISLNLPTKIKTARKKSGYSQKQFGQIIGVSDKAVSAYEVGRATPPIETLQHISHATATPIVYFLEEETSDEMEIEMRITKIERDLSEIKELLRKKNVPTPTPEQSPITDQ